MSASESDVKPKTDATPSNPTGEIFSSIKERLNHPIFGWYLTTFVLVNWKEVSVLIASSVQIESRVATIQQMLSASPFVSYGIPVLVALIREPASRLFSLLSNGLIGVIDRTFWIPMIGWLADVKSLEELRRNELEGRSKLSKATADIADLKGVVKQLQEDKNRLEIELARKNEENQEASRKLVTAEYGRKFSEEEHKDELRKAYRGYLDLLEVINNAVNEANTDKIDKVRLSLNPNLWKTALHVTLSDAARNFLGSLTVSQLSGVRPLRSSVPAFQPPTETPPPPQKP